MNNELFYVESSLFIVYLQPLFFECQKFLSQFLLLTSITDLLFGR